MPLPEPPAISNPLALLSEGERVMRICNACRYCEGFCAVFPAMERRWSFSESDLHYLANLCHDCGECYYCCQYAPPHEFNLNLPLALAEIRRETYRRYAWPGWLRGWFNRSGLALLCSALVIPLLFFFWLRSSTEPGQLFTPHSVAEGSFYRVLGHAAMVAIFGVAGLLAFIALMAGALQFWVDSGEGLGAFFRPWALARAVSDTLRLRYLEGAGEGCAYPNGIPSQARRWFHHLTFYGFLFCFAATTVAAIYHYFLGWEAPYAVLSAPVVLGSIGGTGLLIGPLGLLWLKTKRDAELQDHTQASMDVAFLVLLWLTSLSGVLLLVFRESAAMGALLAAHLGIVLGLFLTLPYGKFVHGIYRFAALLRNAEEARRAGSGGSAQS